MFAVGLSHNIYHASGVPHRLRRLEPPFHTSVGTIVKLGPETNRGKLIFSVGNRVAIVRCKIPCTHCDGCQQAKVVKEQYDTRTCEESSNGIGVAGDITQYVLALEYSLAPIPNCIGFKQAAVLVGARVSSQTFLSISLTIFLGCSLGCAHSSRAGRRRCDWHLWTRRACCTGCTICYRKRPCHCHH